MKKTPAPPHWLDKHIAQQRAWRDRIEAVTAPFSPEEVAEAVTELDEPPFDQKTGRYLSA